MKNKRFETVINASPEKVWKALWDQTSYREWTRVFAEGSDAVTDNWKEGSKVLFTDGKGSGMVSTVATNSPNKQMSFRHLGVVNNGVEDTTSEQVKGWAGAMESYYLKPENGKTQLAVEMDITEDFLEYFEEKFPLALAKVKELAEG